MTRGAGALLLDVNLLVALAYPSHVLHQRATAWFEGPEAAEWATCPLTEAGLVRLSLQPAVAGERLTARQALGRLDLVLGVAGLQRWSLPAGLLDSPVVRRAPFAGHRQVTDVLLLAVAAEHGGRLATLDAGLAHAVATQDRHLVVLVG